LSDRGYDARRRRERCGGRASPTEVDGLSVELFVLRPEGYDGPTRIDVNSARDAATR
jgi:hypothetical protein